MNVLCHLPSRVPDDVVNAEMTADTCRLRFTGALDFAPVKRDRLAFAIKSSCNAG